MKSEKQASDGVRIFEAIVYLAATAATIYLTVEEWRIRQAITEIRAMMQVRRSVEPPTGPSATEISELHREIRSIIEEA